MLFHNKINHLSLKIVLISFNSLFFNINKDQHAIIAFPFFLIDYSIIILPIKVFIS